MGRYNPDWDRKYAKTEKGRAAHRRAMERYRAKKREQLLAYQREYARAHYTHTPKAHEPGVCLFCGQTFTPSHGNQLYCSNSCTIRARNQRVRARDIESGKIRTFTKVCKWCGKSFETTNSNKVYCDADCKRSAASSRERASAGQFGMREDQMRAVERDMALPPGERYSASRRWTQAQRKYAQKLYMVNHGIFSR